MYNTLIELKVPRELMIISNLAHTDCIRSKESVTDEEFLLDPNKLEKFYMMQ
jgi:hypothetical protein